MEQQGERLEFGFADGLRGIAALAVAVLHAYLFTGLAGQAKAELPHALHSLVPIGQLSVAVFIVLSGFVLMLPVAGRAGLTLPRGTAHFLARRARRILPPYYAALALVGLVILLVPAVQTAHGTAWEGKVPVSTGGVVSHLLLVHNVVPAWNNQIIGPAWSVASEWQIYLLMPFVLLPLWRRWGGVATVTVTVLVGWALHFALPVVDIARPSFVGCFALGMGAAVLVVQRRELPGLRPLAVVGAAGLLALVLVKPDGVAAEDWLFDTVAGVVVAAGLVELARDARDGRPPRLRRVLESRVAAHLGLWSYSLYLIHSPVLAFGAIALIDVEMSLPVRLAVQVGVVLPVALALAYAFHRLVERRFMTSHQRHAQAAGSQGGPPSAGGDVHPAVGPDASASASGAPLRDDEPEPVSPQ